VQVLASTIRIHEAARDLGVVIVGRCNKGIHYQSSRRPAIPGLRQRAVLQHHWRADAPPPVGPQRYYRWVGDGHSAIRPHIASFPQAALVSSAATRRVQGGHHGPPGAVWPCSQLPGRRLLLRHRRSSKKTALGRDSYASRQSDADQLGRQCLLRSWTLVWNSLLTDLRQPNLSYSHFRQSLDIFSLVRALYKSSYLANYFIYLQY